MKIKQREELSSVTKSLPISFLIVLRKFNMRKLGKLVVTLSQQLTHLLIKS